MSILQSACTCGPLMSSQWIFRLTSLSTFQLPTCSSQGSTETKFSPEAFCWVLHCWDALSNAAFWGTMQPPGTSELVQIPSNPQASPSMHSCAGGGWILEKTSSDCSCLEPAGLLSWHCSPSGRVSCLFIRMNLQLLSPSFWQALLHSNKKGYFPIW